MYREQKPALANRNRKTNALKDTAEETINLVEYILVQPLWKTNWHCLLKLNTVYAKSMF